MILDQWEKTESQQMSQREEGLPMFYVMFIDNILTYLSVFEKKEKKIILKCFYTCQKYERKVEESLKRLLKCHALFEWRKIDFFFFVQIWHTHQLNPESYGRDTSAVLGFILKHDDSVNDRSDGSKLNRADEVSQCHLCFKKLDRLIHYTIIL